MKKEISSPSYITIGNYHNLLTYQHARSLSPLTPLSQEIVSQPYSNLFSTIQLIPIVTSCYPLLSILMSVASSSDYELKYSVRSENKIFVSLAAANMDQRAIAPTITLLLSASPKQPDNLSCVITVRAGFMVYQTQNYIQNPKTLLTTLRITLLAALYCQNYTHTSLLNLFSERPTTWGLPNMRILRRLSRFANPKSFIKYYLRAAERIPNLPQCRLVFKMRFFLNAETMASYALLEGSHVIHSFYAQIFKILSNTENN